jgi:hypothetical protein
VEELEILRRDPKGFGTLYSVDRGEFVSYRGQHDEYDKNLIYEHTQCVVLRPLMTGVIHGR